MQVSVEKVNNVLRRLDFVVPAEQVETAYSAEINRLARNAKLDGFRPGKAPLSFITKRFGDEARREAITQVIQKSLYNALSEHQLRPISSPEVEPKVMLADQPLEFSASFEVLPEIEKINFSLDSVEKLDVPVSDDDVERVVKQLQKQYTQWKIVDRAAKMGDRVVIDYTPSMDGKEETEHKVEKYTLELGSKVMLPGFEDGLVGSKAGDQKTLELQFPEDFHDKARAGKPVSFAVTVVHVYEADEPALDATFMKKLAIKSGDVNDLKTQIRQSLEQERDRLVKEKLKEQVFRNLIEQNEIDVPKSLIEKEAKVIHDEMYPQHHHHDHGAHSEQETTMFNDIAKKRVLLGLLIAEFGKQNSLKPDAARVQQRINEIAAAYEQPQEVIAWLSSEERRHGIESQVMEDQVLEKLLDGINSTTKTMTYAELKGIRI